MKTHMEQKTASKLLVIFFLKIEEKIVQLHVGLPVDALANKESQFVGILAGGRHSDNPLWQTIYTMLTNALLKRLELLKYWQGCYLPVVVHVAQLVCKSLHVIWLQTTTVMDDVVMSRRDASRANGLAHNVEIIPGTIREQDFTYTCSR